MAYTQIGPPAAGDWVPQPDFAAQQDKEGGWTATQSFTIARDTLDLETFQDDFRINRPIEDLYPEIEGFWRFLGLASIPRVKHIAGDYTAFRDHSCTREGLHHYTTSDSSRVGLHCR